MLFLIQSNRERGLMLSVIAALVFVGLAVGLRQHAVIPSYSEFSDEEIPNGVLEARTNEELSTNPWRIGSQGWVPPQEDITASPVTPKDLASYERAMDTRATGRAFEGAPPTIPHPVGQGSAKECMVCHENGATIGAVSAPPIPHFAYQICTQCHVPQSGPMSSLSTPRHSEAFESDFVGLRGAPYPYRATEGAPPQQPHSSFMREQCSSCHGERGMPGLQTSHPERQSCQQCHAASAQVDQR